MLSIDDDFGKRRIQLPCVPLGAGILVMDFMRAHREAAALAEEAVRKHVEGKEIVKRIVIPDKLVNLVVKG